MKADISDAPERVIRRQHKRGVFYLTICLVSGIMITAGAFRLINDASNVGPPPDQSINPALKERVPVQASEMPARQNLVSSQPQASNDIPAPANTARQTVFNDQNFTPRGADNVATLHAGSEPLPRTGPSKKVKLTIVRQPPTMKERACWPYKQGSIESRNCRAAIGLKHRN